MRFYVYFYDKNYIRGSIFITKDGMQIFPILSEMVVTFNRTKSYGINLVKGKESTNNCVYLFYSDISYSNSNFSLRVISEKGKCVYMTHYATRSSRFLKQIKIIGAPLENKFSKTDPISEIVVIATMSSGKSTLINALLRKNLMPYENLACTSIIATITNSDGRIKKELYGRDAQNKLIEKKDEVSFEKIKELNSNPLIKYVNFESRIHCLPVDKRICLVDTPGTNSAENPLHQEITFEKVKNVSNALIIYVLNVQQLATEDDVRLLQHVSENLQRNHIVFVLNKIDEIDTEAEKISHALRNAKKYIKSLGISSPIIIPCSTRAALSIINNDKFNYEVVSQLPFSEFNNLSQKDQKTYEYVHKFISNKSYFLENYVKLTRKQKRNLKSRIRRYKKMKNYKELVLYHSGLRLLEKEIKKHIGC